MAESQTAARPYAQAVFQLAQARGQLQAWSDMLRLLAAIATDARMVRIAFNPHLARARLAQLFLDIGGDRLSPEGANFVRLLIENRRLLLLPQIAALFEQLKAHAESRIDVDVITAFPLVGTERRQIEEALKRKLQRDINVTASVDQDLIGGVFIRAGDLVIDGSVRGRLQQLAAQLAR